jgi:pseudouridylate synthase
LDLGLTLEVLETNGVPVVGFGTNVFPAFYSRTSEFAVPMSVANAQELASMMQAKWRLNLRGGIVVANPIPAAHEIPASEINPFIKTALAEAEAQNISGKHVTPFLLKRLAEITAGRSLTANIALVMNNARVAAEIALAYAAKHGK